MLQIRWVHKLLLKGGLFSIKISPHNQKINVFANKIKRSEVWNQSTTRFSQFRRWRIESNNPIFEQMLTSHNIKKQKKTAVLILSFPALRSLYTSQHSTPTSSNLISHSTQHTREMDWFGSENVFARPKWRAQQQQAEQRQQPEESTSSHGYEQQVRVFVGAVIGLQ